MARTRRRAFATGALPHTPAVAAADRRAARRRGRRRPGSRSTPMSALFVFLGAFFYAVVYTRLAQAAQLAEHRRRRPGRQLRGAGRRRGGRPRARAAAAAAGAGAVPVDAAALLEPGHRQPAPTTPPPACRCCRWWSAPSARRASCSRSTVALVAASLLPLFFGAGWIYVAGRAGRRRALRAQGLRAGARTRAARRRWRSFFASLVQLSAAAGRGDDRRGCCAERSIARRLRATGLGLLFAALAGLALADAARRTPSRRARPSAARCAPARRRSAQLVPTTRCWTARAGRCACPATAASRCW